MHFYKISTLGEQLLGAVSSNDLRYYNERKHRIFCCDERQAQYVYLNDKFYRPGWFNTESKEIEGTYEEVLCQPISEDEYMEIRNNQNSIEK